MSNKFRFVIPNDEQYILLPIELKWDMYGQEDSIELYEEDVIRDIINSPEDFELLRFSHKPYDNDTKTDVKYDFNFYNGNVNDVASATSSDWVNSYLPEGFEKSEIYYYEKPFTKSFFKLDFYDTMDGKSQTNYFTIIIPVQQGFTETVTLSPYIPDVLIKRPSYKLDFVGDKEGFFIYWLKNVNFYDLTTFYMSAKFFDGKLGVFVKMMKVPQSSPLIPSVFEFESKYFYYKVNLDYVNKTYEILDDLNVRVGTTSSIKWYEYINP